MKFSLIPRKSNLDTFEAISKLTEEKELRGEVYISVRGEINNDWSEDAERASEQDAMIGAFLQHRFGHETPSWTDVVRYLRGAGVKFHIEDER